MLATFLVEICLIVYTVWRYKLNPVARLVVLLLLFLAIFQLSEYMLCGGLGWTGVEWTRFGYASITMLPPLGLHLAITLAKKPQFRWLALLAYITAGLFIYFFIFVTRSLDGVECRPNYVVFHLNDSLVYLFVLYYYGWMAITTTLAIIWSRTSKYRRQLLALCAGYAAFIVPTTLVTIINPATVDGIPSIMCGFAVLMAITLVGWVLPGAARKR